MTWFLTFLFLITLKTEQYYSKLIWISIDAFKYDIFESGNYTFLENAAKNGVHAAKLHPMFVSKTFPNHLSAVTGLTVEEHGVIANSIKDKELGQINFSTIDRKWWDPKNKTLPIWTIVEQNGGNAAVIYWPGSAVAFGGVHPKFYHKVYNPKCDALCRIEEAVSLVKNETYDLIMVYLSDYDSACHKYGPESSEARNAMKTINDLLESFIYRINSTKYYDSTSIMISGDHGMASISDTNVIMAAEVIGNHTDIEMVQDGPVGMFNCEKLGCEYLINKLKNYRHVLFAGYKDMLKKEFHYSKNKRIPDVIVIMEEGWMIKYSNISYGKGSHGYPWQWASSMNSKFIGFNGRFKKGVVLEPMQITDLFSIACKILNLEDKCHTKGSLHSSIFKQAWYYELVIPVLFVFTALIISMVVLHCKKRPKKTVLNLTQ